jgi:serine beta-lactamase-like protein LACTB, mitochondrial
MKLLFTLSMGLAAAWIVAQEPLEARLARVEEAIQTHMKERRVTGAAVAIAHRGRIVFEKGFGMADLEHDVPFRAETVCRLASVSKPVTAVAVMKLVEQGKIDLDADIRKYAPEFPDKGVTIRVRDILSHSSGIRHYVPFEKENYETHLTVVSSLDRFMGDPLLHPPGEKVTYSTYAFNLLARAVETATEKSFREGLQELVFGPAGMTASGLEDLQGIVKHRARGYRRLPDGRLVRSAFADISYKWAGGGMASTAPDLCRFGMAILGGKLLNKETVERMWTQQTLRDGSKTDQALGWQIAEFRGKKVRMHGGAQQETRTFLAIVPEDELVVALVSNYESHNPAEMATRLRDAWYGPAAGSKDLARAGANMPSYLSAPQALIFWS